MGPATHLRPKLPGGIQRMSGEQQAGRPNPAVQVVPAEELIGALSVQEDLDSFRMSGSHDGMLRMDGPRSVRLALGPEDRHHAREERSARRCRMDEAYPRPAGDELGICGFVDPMSRKSGVESKARHLRTVLVFGPELRDRCDDR